MEIELRYFGTVRKAVGESGERRSVDEGATVGSVLADLESEHPGLAGLLLDAGAVAGGVTVLRNGTHVTHFDGVETVLDAGDRLSITPPVTGGRANAGRGPCRSQSARRPK
jgi:molybdopterin synthase sulfur carrier subunit